MYPYDAQTKTIFTPATGGTECPEILPAVDHPRTLLQGVIITGGADLGKIKISDDSQIYLDNQRQDFISLDTPVVFQNQAIICERANNKPFQFTITYVDYDLTTRGNLTIEHPTVPIQSFLIDKSYSYGDITMIFVLGLIALFVIFYVLKRIFTHDEVKIHSYQTKF